MAAASPGLATEAQVVRRRLQNRGTMRIRGLLVVLLLSIGCSDHGLVGPPSDQIQTPCANPARLLGQSDPQAPGYIVVYHDVVNGEQETARLAARYGFAPRFVYTHALPGFSSELAPSVVAAVRCEATVDYVAYDSRVSIAGSGPAW